MKFSIPFLAALLLLSGCRCIDYSTPDNRHLFVMVVGMDSSIGDLQATGGDSTIHISSSTSTVDPATMKTIDDALALAIQLLSKVPALGDLAPTTQPSTR